MPQAKFQVVGKFTDKEGNQHRPGDILSLKVGEDGKPVDQLAGARVRPYRGAVQVEPSGEGVPQDVKDSVDAYVKDAEAKVEAMIKEAEEKAAQIVDAASQQAAQIVADAESSKTTKK